MPLQSTEKIENTEGSNLSLCANLKSLAFQSVAQADHHLALSMS